MSVEVEVKIRLRSREAHDEVDKIMRQSGKYKTQYAQENIFFDGSQKELYVFVSFVCDVGQEI